MRVCAEAGCPTLTKRTRCPAHERAKDRARGTRQERGYDAEHEARRARWSLVVAQGRTNCARCGEPIGPHEPWDLGHDDHDRTRYAGPEHAACNRATAGRSACG